MVLKGFTKCEPGLEFNVTLSVGSALGGMLPPVVTGPEMINAEAQLDLDIGPRLSMVNEIYGFIAWLLRGSVVNVMLF